MYYYCVFVLAELDKPLAIGHMCVWAGWDREQLSGPNSVFFSFTVGYQDLMTGLQHKSIYLLR